MADSQPQPKPTKEAEAHPSLEVQQELAEKYHPGSNCSPACSHFDAQPQHIEGKELLTLAKLFTDDKSAEVLAAQLTQYIQEQIIGEDEELGADGLRKSDGATINNIKAEQRAQLRKERNQ